jgi:hypothetical protein
MQSPPARAIPNYFFKDHQPAGGEDGTLQKSSQGFNVSENCYNPVFASCCRAEALGYTGQSPPARARPDLILKDHKPPAMQGKARLRGRERNNCSTTIFEIFRRSVRIKRHRAACVASGSVQHRSATGEHMRAHRVTHAQHAPVPAGRGRRHRNRTHSNRPAWGAAARHTADRDTQRRTHRRASAHRCHCDRLDNEAQFHVSYVTCHNLLLASVTFARGSVREENGRSNRLCLDREIRMRTDRKRSE